MSVVGKTKSVCLKISKYKNKPLAFYFQTHFKKIMKYKFLSLLILVASSSTFAQKEKGRTDAQWTNLFDGKTLKGFKQLGGKAIYEVQNGEIVGTTVKDTPNSFLATEQ
jgi:hypothetical protein